MKNIKKNLKMDLKYTGHIDQCRCKLKAKLLNFDLFLYTYCTDMAYK